MKKDKEIELPDIVFSDDDLIEYFYKKRGGKEEYDRKALLEVWYCFKEFLIKEMKSGSRVKIYRDMVLQKDLDIPKLFKNEKWLNNHLKIAYVLEKYFKNGNNKNTLFKKEEENTE